MLASPVPVLVLLYAALTAAASPVTTSSQLASPSLWPKHVSARRVFANYRRLVDPELIQSRQDRETNGQRIARGLLPLAPKKRYDPSATHALVPRVSGAPTTASGFQFSGCYGQISSTFETLDSTSTNAQQAAEFCAEYANSRGADTFAIQPVDTVFYCGADITGTSEPQECNETNAGLYGRQIEEI